MKKRVFGFTVGALIVIGVVAVMAGYVWSWLKPKAEGALDSAKAAIAPGSAQGA